MKVWSGQSTLSDACVICGRKSGAYSEFKTAGITLKISACQGPHINYVQRQYACELIKPILIQARIIAHGRPGQGESSNARNQGLAPQGEHHA